jgi:predicted HD superfamily hydrolase involved in NAD metabolism
VDRQIPVLLHGPVGAEILQREDGLDDTSTYNAISWHSTAHPSLDILGKVIFLADKLDPEKISYYPYLDLIRPIAFEDLDRAVLEFITRETIARMNRGELVHPLTMETRNRLLTSSATTGLAGS